MAVPCVASGFAHQVVNLRGAADLASLRGARRSRIGESCSLDCTKLEGHEEEEFSGCHDVHPNAS